MKMALKYLGVFQAAFALRIGSVLYWPARSPLDPDWVGKGPWKTNMLKGSMRSGMSGRARIAVAETGN